MTNLLHFFEVGTGPSLIILHGLFGSGDNWRTLAKRFSSDFRVILVDLRNHGESFHSETHSYPLMAEDIARLCAFLKLESACILGHSMGGKVAMQIASINPGLVKRLIVVDIAPKKYPKQHEDILKGLEGLSAGVTSRTDADSLLSEFVQNVGVRGFLLKNLRRVDHGFKLTLNSQSLTQNYSEITAAPIFKNSFLGPSLFINGSLSDYVTVSDHSLIRKWFPNAKIVYISNAGHWVHAEAPDAFFEHAQSFLLAE